MAREGYWVRYYWCSTAWSVDGSAVMATIPVGYTLDRTVVGWQLMGNGTNNAVLGISGVWSLSVAPSSRQFAPSQWFDQNAEWTWLWWAGIRHHYETPTRAPGASANLPTLWAGTPTEGIDVKSARLATETTGDLNLWWQWGWALGGGYPCYAWAEVSCYILAPEGVTLTPEERQALHAPRQPDPAPTRSDWSDRDWALSSS